MVGNLAVNGGAKKYGQFVFSSSPKSFFRKFFRDGKSVGALWDEQVFPVLPEGKGEIATKGADRFERAVYLPPIGFFSGDGRQSEYEASVSKACEADCESLTSQCANADQILANREFHEEQCRAKTDRDGDKGRETCAVDMAVVCKEMELTYPKMTGNAVAGSEQGYRIIQGLEKSAGHAGWRVRDFSNNTAHNVIRGLNCDGSCGSPDDPITGVFIWQSKTAFYMYDRGEYANYHETSYGASEGRGTAVEVDPQRGVPTLAHVAMVDCIWCVFMQGVSGAGLTIKYSGFLMCAWALTRNLTHAVHL